MLATQFARLRGLAVRHGSSPEVSLPLARSGSTPLFAITFAAFGELTSRQRESLRASVNDGATFYIRGAIDDGVRYQLAPLIDASFTVARVSEVASYRFTDHEMIPAVLRGETGPVGEALHCAGDLSGQPEPILLACHRDGAESPVVFAYRSGTGVIICDVQPDAETADSPLIWRLADPVMRRVNASALIAADRAAGRDVATPVPFNLTIDDIPLGYDYFNESVLEDFVDHIEGRCADVHLDCGWIPTSRFISRRYVEVLKSHRAGFLWHGMHRHVDHQTIDDAEAEMQAGKLAMAANVRRYGVTLQPVIIFPLERSHRSAEEMLLKEGFLAAAEQPRNDETAIGTPEYLRYCNESYVHQSGLRFLHRYESQFLTRDRMIALASLGMPIVAFAHPRDVGLKRLSRFVERGGTFSHFDEVLDFASGKGLLGRSLQEIAENSRHQSAA